MEGKRGTIAFFSTYRPPVPLDIFSCEAGKRAEEPITDGLSYNYNGQLIPPSALKSILKRPKLSSLGYTESDVDSARVSGMMFVSERDNGLETLHVAVRATKGSQISIFSFGELYEMPKDVRMEDSPCFAGDYLVYVSTKEPNQKHRQPWTAVYKTNLRTGKTDRLTKHGVANLSPSVSPSGKMVAVASFQGKGGWHGEIADLKTDIYVMNIDGSSFALLVVNNGGWPTWGSDNVIFFHRRDDNNIWGVYRADIGSALKTKVAISGNEATRVTPEGMNAMTPAAIDSETVAVAIIRKESTISNAQDGRENKQYRHIEVFEQKSQTVRKVTEMVTPKADHFNPFVIDAGKRIIGYHRCKISDHVMSGGHIERTFLELKSPNKDVEVIRAPGVFPTFSSDGSRLAFVDNEFKAVWVADSEGLRVVFNSPEENRVFSTVWSQKEGSETLYVCEGPSFQADQKLHIRAIPNVRKKFHKSLTDGDSNNAFPSTNKDGTKIVFRSNMHGSEKRYKSLYIMDSSGENVKRLTTRDNCTDTHCMWSPKGDWIVFASDRDKPTGAPQSDNNLDSGCFAVFLVKWNDPGVIIRVMQSGTPIAGHVNHPVFSPDGKSVVVTADLAAVSVDPISMPLVTHSVRPYGDIFTFDIDTVIASTKKKIQLQKFERITHSRYENSTATWTMFSPIHQSKPLKLDFKGNYEPACPYIHTDGGQSWHMSGHLCIKKSCC